MFEEVQTKHTQNHKVALDICKSRGDFVVKTIERWLRQGTMLHAEQNLKTLCISLKKDCPTSTQKSEFLKNARHILQRRIQNPIKHLKWSVL